MTQKPISNLKQVKVGEELLSPKVDFVFKNLFGSDENVHLTSAFLEGILNRPETDFIKRVLFYNGKLFTRQAKKGKSYHSISKTIIVLVLNFELICDSIDWIHQFTYYDKVKYVEFTKLSEIITIELPKLRKTTNT